MVPNYTHNTTSASLDYASHIHELAQPEDEHLGSEGSYTIEDTFHLDNVASKNIQRSFGRDEDFVEVTIHNELGDQIDVIKNFTNYLLNEVL